MKVTHTALPFTLLAFILASLLAAAAVFAQPACDPGFTDDGDSIAAATDVDDDNDGLIEICNLLGLDSIRNKLDGTAYKGSDPDGSGSMTAPAETSMGCPDTGCTGYELVKDLDFEDDTEDGYKVAWTVASGGTGWSRIGSGSSGLACTFEGNGYKIRNLYLVSSEFGVGFFAEIEEDGKVQNLGLEDVEVTASVIGGVLVGNNQGVVSGCYTTGLLTASAEGSTLGGLVGQNELTVRDCHSTVVIDATAVNAIGTKVKVVGGLMGKNISGATVTRCYAIGSVQGADKGGGLVGENFGTVTSCYATGSVTGNRLGGLVGWLEGSINNSYSTGAVSGASDVGGLVGIGEGSPRINASFWDTTSSGQNMSAGGSGATGKITADMKALTVASTTWDTDDWNFGDTTQYPALKKDGTVVVGQPCPRVECDPLVSIAAGTSPVTEGTAAEFTLTRTGSTTDALTVTVSVTGGDSFLSGADTTEAIFGAGEATVTLSLATENDEVDEADGTVTATITAETSNFRLGTATATVDIADDDLPLVSIEAVTASVTEGTAAEFTLTRVGDTTAALTVMVVVTGGDSFLSGAALTEAIFGAGDATVTLSLATAVDEVDEADGTVTVTITADASNFRLGDAAASVAVQDDDLPLVSIAAGTSPVTEGTAAEFTLTRVGVTTAALTVMVAITDPDGFLSGAATTQAVFGAGDATVILSLTTDDDDMDEAEGMVTVTVTEAVTSYRVDADNSSATVTVTDDDEPPPGTALSFLGTISDQTYTQNTTITALVLPEATGGTGPYTYTLTPVPAGLMFDEDPASRTLSGMPTATTDTATTHTYMVTDSTTTALTKTLTFTITVNAEGTLSFSGTVPNQTYTKNTAITDLELPVATGGMGPYRYTLVPVPAGLMFDATTRTLSGMPTAVTPTPTTHTYTVTDTTADTALTESMTFTITVNEEGSPTFADTIANQTYTENTVITDLVLPVATGGMGSLTYALTPVPDGLEFDATNRTLSGTPTIPTPTPTTHTYTVTDTTPVTALTAALTFTITVSEEAETTFGIGSQAAAVHVYPNPAGDVLHIEFPGAGDYGIALLTVTGQQVFGGQHAGGGTKKLDVSTLKGGVYFLKIEDGEGGSHTVRIIL